MLGLLPGEHHRLGKRAHTLAFAAHAANDLLAEEDPELVVVDQPGLAFQLRERHPTRRLEQVRVELQTELAPSLGVSLWP